MDNLGDLIDYESRIFNSNTRIDYERSTSAVNASSTSPCPQSVRRYVQTIFVECSAAGAFAAITITRGGINYGIYGSTSRLLSSTHEIILMPGDIVRGADAAAQGGNVYVVISYIDVPINTPVFKKGRRG